MDIHKARELVEVHKKKVSELLRMVSEFKSKEECIINLTASSYQIFLLMNMQVKVTKDKVNYLMGQVLPLLEVLTNDKNVLDEGFGVAVANRMHEYYEAYFKDMEEAFDNYEKQHGSVH